MADDMMDDKKSEKSGDDKDFYVCGVFSPLCSAIFVGAILVLELAFLIYELVVIENNSFFDNSYGVIFFFLLIPILLSIIILIVFFFNYKSPKAREYIPEACLLASITNFFIALWIFLYISTIYEYHSVAVEKRIGTGPKQEYIDMGPSAVSDG